MTRPRTFFWRGKRRTHGQPDSWPPRAAQNPHVNVSLGCYAQIASWAAERQLTNKDALEMALEGI